MGSAMPLDLTMRQARGPPWTNTASFSRTRDGGRTWRRGAWSMATGPGRVQPLTGEFHDPETDDILPQPGYPSSTIAPDSAVYVAYENGTSPTSGGIGVVRSRDGGVTWTTIALPGVSAFAFEPAIAVDKHGTRSA